MFSFGKRRFPLSWALLTMRLKEALPRKLLHLTLQHKEVRA